MESPTISIVLPSYNHEKYILEALDSIHQQTYQDYEILILDDASTDRSAAVIKEFIQNHPDLPIRFDQHETNQGGVITLNDLLQQARGKYIALLNSDDVWVPEKLARQAQYLNEHPEIAAVFTQAIIVDENREKVSDKVLPVVIQDTFLQENRSRGKWFRRFFFQQNCLCHPSILIRRTVYEQIGYLDPRFRQIPDFQLWTRFLKSFEFHLIEEPMVYLRWHKSNTSVISTSNSIRGINELFYLYRDFFTGMPDDLFIDGFGDLFRRNDARTPEALACEKAFVFFLPEGHIHSIYHNIGLDKLYHLLGDPVTCRVLAEQYNFTYDNFFALGGKNGFDGSLLANFVQQPAPSNAPAPVVPSDAPASIPMITPAAPPTGIKFAIGEILIKYPPLYNFARKLYRTITGKNM